MIILEWCTGVVVRDGQCFRGVDLAFASSFSWSHVWSNFFLIRQYSQGVDCSNFWPLLDPALTPRTLPHFISAKSTATHTDTNPVFLLKGKKLIDGLVWEKYIRPKIHTYAFDNCLRIEKFLVCRVFKICSLKEWNSSWVFAIKDGERPIDFCNHLWLHPGAMIVINCIEIGEVWMNFNDL